MIWLLIALSLIIYFLVLYIIKIKSKDFLENTKGNEKGDGSALTKYFGWINQLFGRNVELIKDISFDKNNQIVNDSELENSVIIKKVYNDVGNIKNTYICPTEDVHDSLDKPVDVLVNVDVSIKKAATLFDIIGKDKISQEINPNNIDETLQAMSEEDNDDYTDEIGVPCFYV